MVPGIIVKTSSAIGYSSVEGSSGEAPFGGNSSSIA